MDEKIVKIMEIRDDSNGENVVNSLLQKGWIFISACQVGTPEHMDIVYVVGATQEILDAEETDRSKGSSVLQHFLKN